MAIVRRFDRGELSKPRRLANGWLKVDGYVGRTGLLEYKHADGSTWVEYRPPDEAFRADVLESFEGVPLTNDHPASGGLDASNTREHQVGTVGRPTQDGKFARASITVTDAAAIAAIEGGKHELSMGYACTLDCTPGMFEGQHYDAIQRDISGNHVALVDRARGGAEIRLRVDGHDTLPVESRSKQDPGQAQRIENVSLIKIKVDGLEVEVSELAAQVIAKANEQAGAARKLAQDALDKSNARADMAEAEIVKLKASLAEAPAKARTAIEARIKLEANATRILGADVKLDGLEDIAIKRLVGAKGGLKVDGKADAYVEFAYDAVIEKGTDAPGALAPAATAATAPVKADAADDSLEAAQAKFRADMREAHKSKQARQ